jgi:ech hydrogenase subunit E
VRIRELFVTFNALRSILDNMPSGDISVRMPRKVPAGETISRIEAPRGELLYFIKSGGGERPERLKIRTPSMCNFGSVIATVVGHQLADVPLILAGIDPCFSCNDRMIHIRTSQGDRMDWTWEDLRQHAIRTYQK